MWQAPDRPPCAPPPPPPLSGTHPRNGSIDREELRRLLSTLEGGKTTTMMTLEDFVIEDDLEAAMTK
jgi:hypothetical protein